MQVTEPNLNNFKEKGDKFNRGIMGYLTKLKVGDGASAQEQNEELETYCEEMMSPLYIVDSFKVASSFSLWKEHIRYIDR